HMATNGFAFLGLPEFHLYCKKSCSHASNSQVLIDAQQARPNCKAFVTWKRSLENYLHPEVVRTADGQSVSFDDESDVPERLAICNGVVSSDRPWHLLTARDRRRLIGEARRWLCNTAVHAMTLDLLQERDPFCEVLDWFMKINEMLPPA